MLVKEARLHTLYSICMIPFISKKGKILGTEINQCCQKAEMMGLVNYKGAGDNLSGRCILPVLYFDCGGNYQNIHACRDS